MSDDEWVCHHDLHEDSYGIWCARCPRRWVLAGGRLDGLYVQLEGERAKSALAVASWKAAEEELGQVRTQHAYVVEHLNAAMAEAQRLQEERDTERKARETAEARAREADKVIAIAAEGAAQIWETSFNQAVAIAQQNAREREALREAGQKLADALEGVQVQGVEPEDAPCFCDQYFEKHPSDYCARARAALTRWNEVKS